MLWPSAARAQSLLATHVRCPAATAASASNTTWGLACGTPYRGGHPSGPPAGGASRRGLSHSADSHRPTSAHPLGGWGAARHAGGGRCQRLDGDEKQPSGQQRLVRSPHHMLLGQGGEGMHSSGARERRAPSRRQRARCPRPLPKSRRRRTPAQARGAPAPPESVSQSRWPCRGGRVPGSHRPWRLGASSRRGSSAERASPAPIREGPWHPEEPSGRPASATDRVKAPVPSPQCRIARHGEARGGHHLGEVHTIAPKWTPCAMGTAEWRSGAGDRSAHPMAAGPRIRC